MMQTIQNHVSTRSTAPGSRAIHRRNKNNRMLPMTAESSTVPRWPERKEGFR